MNDNRERFIAENSEYNFNEDLVTFTLIDESTIARREREGDIRLPAKKIDVPKDERWNTKQLNSKLLAGILNGDSVDRIAHSLVDVIGNNKASQMRNARTMVTQAECGGRQDSYESLAAKGVAMKKVWIATPDDRTRESHIDLDGEEVDIDADFSNGLEYPADPSGEPEEVWNCRCSMRTHIVGFKRADGTIVHVDYERDDTMHDKQMAAQKAERAAEDKANKGASIKQATTRQEAYEVLKTMFGSINDNVKRIDEQLLCENVNQLQALNEKFGVITNENVGYFTSSASGRAMAWTSNRFAPDPNGNVIEECNLSLVSKYYNDPKLLINTETRGRDKFWGMPMSDEYLSTYSITHEYGHILENHVLVSRTDYATIEEKISAYDVSRRYKEYRKYEKNGAKQIYQEIVDIAKENNPEFSIKENLSEYGRTNYFEFFAECFANSQCGDPNELGIAMQQWLEREGF